MPAPARGCAFECVARVDARPVPSARTARIRRAAIKREYTSAQTESILLHRMSRALHRAVGWHSTIRDGGKIDIAEGFFFFFCFFIVSYLLS